MINVAVIGTGYIGPVHIQALCRISGITVKGVADANLDPARRTAEEYYIEKGRHILSEKPKSDTEFQAYGSTTSHAWNHKRSDELWIGHRDKPSETLIESPVLQCPETASYASLPTGHPLGYHDAMLNLMRDFYDVAKAGGKEPRRSLPRPTFGTGCDEMRILAAVVESNRKRAWVKVA